MVCRSTFEHPNRSIMARRSALGCPVLYARITVLLVWLALLTSLPAASQTTTTSSPPPPRMSKQTRMEIVKLLNAELVYVRTPFPMGQTGLKLKDGVVTPNGEELRQALAMWGPAAKKGDPARITNLLFKPNFIHVEINGGPVRKQKWYERISVGGAAGDMSPVSPSDPRANARGSFVDVYFD